MLYSHYTSKRKSENKHTQNHTSLTRQVSLCSSNHRGTVVPMRSHWSQEWNVVEPKGFVGCSGRKQNGCFCTLHLSTYWILLACSTRIEIHLDTPSGKRYASSCVSPAHPMCPQKNASMPLEASSLATETSSRIVA